MQFLLPLHALQGACQEMAAACFCETRCSPHQLRHLALCAEDIMSGRGEISLEVQAIMAQVRRVSSRTEHTGHTLRMTD
jgi:hypothetical protein